MRLATSSASAKRRNNDMVESGSGDDAVDRDITAGEGFRDGARESNHRRIDRPVVGCVGVGHQAGCAGHEDDAAEVCGAGDIVPRDAAGAHDVEVPLALPSSSVRFSNGLWLSVPPAMLTRMPTSSTTDVRCATPAAVPTSAATAPRSAVGTDSHHWLGISDQRVVDKIWSCFDRGSQDRPVRGRDESPWFEQRESVSFAGLLLSDQRVIVVEDVRASCKRRSPASFTRVTRPRFQLSITMVLMGSGRPARSAALARDARRTWAGLTVRMSTGPYVDLFTWPGGKPNTDVKSAPYHLSKSNQQREQHKCARA